MIGKNVDRISTLGRSEGGGGATFVIPYSFITLMTRLHRASHPRGQHVIHSGSLGNRGSLEWRRNRAPTWFELALSNEPPREDGSALQKRLPILCQLPTLWQICNARVDPARYPYRCNPIEPASSTQIRVERVGFGKVGFSPTL